MNIPEPHFKWELYSNQDCKEIIGQEQQTHTPVIKLPGPGFGHCYNLKPRPGRPEFASRSEATDLEEPMEIGSIDMHNMQSRMHMIILLLLG